MFCWFYACVQVGISEVISELLPAHKAAAVRSVQMAEGGTVVAMVRGRDQRRPCACCSRRWNCNWGRGQTLPLKPPTWC